jgi:hypothetical protein
MITRPGHTHAKISQRAPAVPAAPAGMRGQHTHPHIEPDLSKQHVSLAATNMLGQDDMFQ